MSDIMGFPSSWEEFAEQYSFNDSDEVYTNGSRLMQLLRVKQMVEHYFAEPLSRPRVVRCMDCRYARAEPPSDRRSRKKYQGGYWCEKLSEGIGLFCESDDYCSWGEKEDA